MRGTVCTYPVETCKATHAANWGSRHVVGAGAAISHRKGMSGDMLFEQDDAIDYSLTNSYRIMFEFVKLFASWVSMVVCSVDLQLGQWFQ